MSEYEYQTSSPYWFFCRCEGYFIKREHETQLLRVGFYRIHQSLVEKPLRIEQFWPVFGEKQQQQVEAMMVTDKDWWDKMKKLYA